MLPFATVRLYLRVGFALKNRFLCQSGDLRLGTREESFRKEIRALAEGVVKWFNGRKGYGFIKQDEGEDIFVHYSSINMNGFKTLNEGDRVNFEVEKGDRGPVAKDVKKF